ncbi:MAG: ADP-ribosylglycohydrolase family protein [Acidobacteriota bacterium]
MNQFANLSDEKCLNGILLGTAVGDSLGLPAEGLSARRIAKLFRGTWKQRFIFGRGMISDDTEHTVFVAQSLLTRSVDEFRNRLSWKLRLWLLTLPAGIGLATLRSIMKLWLGFSPKRSGVFSAGNGAAMKSAIIGGYFANEPDKINLYVEACTRMTHTDPKALTGALAVAQLTGWIVRNQDATGFAPNKIFSLLDKTGSDKEWQEILRKMQIGYANSYSVKEFAASMNLQRAISGYVYHTVPMAIYSWMIHYGDFRKAVESVLDCGGDTDTVAAIVGALSGATVGERGIPVEWFNRIRDYPFSTTYLRKLSDCLAKQRPDQRITKNKFLYHLIQTARNMLFFAIVLTHIIRRLAPPY